MERVVDVSAIERLLAVFNEIIGGPPSPKMLGACLQEQTRNQNIPAVNFLLERSNELKLDPAFSLGETVALSGNILQIAKRQESREMIIAIRKKCAELKLPLTPRHPIKMAKMLNIRQVKREHQRSVNCRLTAVNG